MKGNGEEWGGEGVEREGGVGAECEGGLKWW